jgi:2-polyprenyl-3-methyl-5-hydroxy-6-metoxy-1,4-benzoquinol methylase
MPENPAQLSPASTNLAAWLAYAAERLTSENDAPPAPCRLNWCQVPGIGPGAEILGDIGGRRILELGCGTGDASAHLADLGALITGIDGAPAQIQRSHRRWQHPRLELLHTEATDYLRRTGPQFDICPSSEPSTGPCQRSSCP